MAKKPTAPQTDPTPAVSNGIEAMLLAAHAHGGDDLQTGRYLVTYKEGAQEAGMKAMKVQSLRTADARDFTSQAVDVADVGHADFAGRAFVTNTPSSASRCKTCTVTARIASAPPAGQWPPPMPHAPCPMPHAPCPMPHAHHAHRASPPRLDHHRHRRPPGRRLGG